VLPAHFLTVKQASGLFQKERIKRSASADVGRAHIVLTEIEVEIHPLGCNFY